MEWDWLWVHDTLQPNFTILSKENRNTWNTWNKGSVVIFAMFLFGGFANAIKPHWESNISK